jgi:hypothetical protein
VGSVLRFLQARALARGRAGKGSTWLVVAAGLWLLNRARSGDDVIFRTKLEPGEGLVIGTAPPGGRPSTGA